MQPERPPTRQKAKGCLPSGDRPNCAHSKRLWAICPVGASPRLACDRGTNLRGTTGNARHAPNQPLDFVTALLCEIAHEGGFRLEVAIDRVEIVSIEREVLLQLPQNPLNEASIV